MRTKRSKTNLFQQQVRKRVKLEIDTSLDDNHGSSQLIEPTDNMMNDPNSFRIKQKDKVEKKVDLIFKDNVNRLNNSLTIWGSGLDVEKTIGVVEELKRVYIKQGKSYKQETTIKTGDNNEPHLQVILTLLDNTDNQE